MKKILVLGAALAFAASIATAESYSLTNIVYGDSDNEGGDFASWSRKEDDATTTDRDEADEFASDGVSIGDRLQFDISSEKFDGRVRLDLYDSPKNGKFTGDGHIRLRAYGRYTPIEQLQFAAGNSFFTKYGVSGAYLVAADDYASSGKAAETGFTFNTNISGVKFIANWAADFVVDDADALGLNFGLDLPIADVVGLGFTAKNVTSDDRTFGGFVNLLSVENLTFGAGFVYNEKDDFLPKATKYAIQASAGYEFEDIGLTLSADVVSGLNNEYIGKDTDGDYDTLEYKNADDDEGIPFHTQVVAGFGVTDNVNVALDVKLNTVFGWDNSTETVVYPYAEYTLPNNFGSLKAGLRFTFNDRDDDHKGLQNFAIPLSWTWKPVNVKN